VALVGKKKKESYPLTEQIVVQYLRLALPYSQHSTI
jgi:hypothetical protein